MALNAVATVFDSETADHGGDGSLRRGVMLTAGHAVEGGDAGGGDQAPALTALFHVGHGLAQREEHPIEVDGQDVAPLVRRHLVEAGHTGAYPRIGETGVDLAEYGQRFFERQRDAFLVGDVTSDGVRLTPMGDQLFLGGFVLVGVAAPDTDRCAGGGKTPRHAEPDSAITAGYDGHAACEIEELCHGASQHDTAGGSPPGCIRSVPAPGLRHHLGATAVPTDDKERWNLKYRGDGVLTEPSGFLLEMRHLLPRQGQALDVAGGTGRNAIVLARRGLDTTIADVSDVALRRAADDGARAGVRLSTVEIDLEKDPLPEGPWDVVLVFHYLYRLLFPDIVRALAPAGVLVAALATTRNRERNEKPPMAYLLDEGELVSLIGNLGVIHYEESWRDDRHEARLVARR